MRITVTGGAGFIGHHLIRNLVAAGHDLTVFDNLRRGSFERPGLTGARLIEGDIRDAAALEAVIAGSAAVVHLAAQANVIGSQDDPAYAYETNVTGTWNVARAASNAGAHLLFASSREVYGEASELPVPETAPHAPANLYGATKAAAEHLLTGLKPTPGVTILRLANVIGEGDSGRVIPLWLEAAASGAPMRLYGGTQLMDFVPVSTVCEAFIAALEHGPLDAPVNVGSGVGITLWQVAERIRELHPEGRVELLPARPVEVTRYIADTRRLRTVLRVEPSGDPLGILPALARAR